MRAAASETAAQKKGTARFEALPDSVCRRLPEATRTDDRHEEHQRPVQAGDKLVQRQHPVIRFRLAQGDAVEGGRDIQHGPQGLRQRFRGRIAGQEQPGWSRRSGKVLHRRLIRIRRGREAPGCQLGKGGGRAVADRQPVGCNERRVPDQQQAGIKGRRGCGRANRVDDNAGNGID